MIPNTHPVYSTYVLRHTSSAIYFKVCCDLSFNTPQSVGILFFSGNADRVSTYCLYLLSTPHRLVKFPHNQELSFTPAEARAAWTTLTKIGWHNERLVSSTST